jgi:NhaP-type Na+/H+ or K+/H+ antiporter
MLPVAVAMFKARLAPASVLFMGWFGPRGLASIVLGLIFLEQEVQLNYATHIVTAVAATVLLSIFAHGVSAQPGIKWYARQVAKLNRSAPELQEAITLTGKSE